MPSDLEPPVRDRDYLVGRDGLVFKVIGDVHPSSHYVGHLKYHPDDGGDRTLFGRRYRRNTVPSTSTAILAERPECSVHSAALGRASTGIPRRDVVAHLSAREGLLAVHRDERVAHLEVGRDLLAIVARLVERGVAEHFGLTGSFLVGCAREQSDIDLVCYGPAGYQAARDLFSDPTLIRPYRGADFAELCRRRALDMPGVTQATLIRRESSKLQGLTAGANRHVNCEPLRTDDDRCFAAVRAREIGAMRLRATITGHDEAVVTPALYRIEVRDILHSSVDDGDAAAERITYLRSYVGGYTGAFCTGDEVVVSGTLLHLRNDGAGDGDGDGEDAYGIELTPWTEDPPCWANLVDAAVPSR